MQDVAVGLLPRFYCSGIDVLAKTFTVYAGTRTPPVEPHWLAGGFSQIEYAIKNDENHGKIPQQKETELRQDSKKKNVSDVPKRKDRIRGLFLLCFAKHKSALSFSFILNLKI